MSIRASLWLFLPTIALAQQGVPLMRHHESLRSAAFDSARNRLVLFDQSGTTWEVDGGEWLLRAPAGGAGTPPARSGAVMAFDSVRRHVLMFGGDSRALGQLSDTWAYDGTSWHQLTGSGPNPISSSAAMAFDSARQRVVFVADSTTWEHDGNVWTRRQPATPPAAIRELRMAYDGSRGVMILCGDGNPASVVCEWNGQDWTTQTTSSQPFRPLALSFDPGRSRVVAVGAGVRADELWEWDGIGWSLRIRRTAPLTTSATCWYDAATARTKVILAHLQDGAVELATSAWDGTTLVTLTQERTQLLDLIDASVLATINQTVLVGGLSTQHLVGTWIRNGRGWQPSPTTTTPSPRTGAASTSTFSSGWLFGGQTPAALPLQDFYQWNGVDWIQLASGPSPRAFASLAADTVTGRMLLFGGLDGATALDDTWQWDGRTWQQLGVSGPTRRFAAALCWDPIRGIAVLHGGRLPGGGLVRDTWEWNGVQWLHPFRLTFPPVMRTPSLTFDWSVQRLRLTGTGGTGAPEDLLWEYTSAGWSQLASQPTIFTTSGNGKTVYDWQSQAMVFTNGKHLLEWTATPATLDAYGSGCGVAPPSIALRQRASLETTSGFELYGPSQLPCVFVLDGAAAALPLGNGCSQLVANASAVWFSATNALGVAVTPIDIPGNAARGVPLFVQGAILDPAAAGGFATTAGLRVTIGN